MKEKIFEAKIVGASKYVWYNKLVGTTVQVVKFTHNYYRDAHQNNRTYHVNDVKIKRSLNNID